MRCPLRIVSGKCRRTDGHIGSRAGLRALLASQPLMQMALGTKVEKRGICVYNRAYFVSSFAEGHWGILTGPVQAVADSYGGSREE